MRIVNSFFLLNVVYRKLQQKFKVLTNAWSRFLMRIIHQKCLFFTDFQAKKGGAYNTPLRFIFTEIR